MKLKRHFSFIIVEKFLKIGADFITTYTFIRFQNILIRILNGI